MELQVAYDDGMIDRLHAGNVRRLLLSSLGVSSLR